MTQRSPWLLISIGISGLVLGYLFVIAKQGSTAFAGGLSCPAHNTCTGADCQKNMLCASGACSKECPGNCNHQS